MAPTDKSLAHARKLTIIARDPSVTIGGRILTAEVDVPAEELLPGPCGYRVNVIDYDASANMLYEQAVVGDDDPFAGPMRRRGKSAIAFNALLLDDPRFHAQNVYAIVMRTLARFEFALGRRIAWGSEGHQVHVAPHAFAGANAFYSREHRGIYFGYFSADGNLPVYTCLSHDIIAHETTHAILDGLRARYLEPSSPDQAAFHEGFSDVVALLSVFSLPGIVNVILDTPDKRGVGDQINKKALQRDALKNSILLKLAPEFGKRLGQEILGFRGAALRESVQLEPDPSAMTRPEFMEEHRRGELLVAAIMNAFLDIWLERIGRLGFVATGRLDRQSVVAEGARAADHLLTIAIRALDYCPPTDISFSDYLSALLTVDKEVVPSDDHNYRVAMLSRFADYGILPVADTNSDGTLRRCRKSFSYSRTHFDSMLRDKEEVFRFVWENRNDLELGDHGYIQVQSVRPCTRVGPDGFVLRETVVEYVQILTATLQELKTDFGILPEIEFPEWRRLRIFGGGTLIFDEYGQVKYQIAHQLANTAEDRRRQKERLESLFERNLLDQQIDTSSRFAEMHLARALK